MALALQHPATQHPIPTQHLYSQKASSLINPINERAAIKLTLNNALKEISLSAKIVQLTFAFVRGPFVSLQITICTSQYTLFYGVFVYIYRLFNNQKAKIQNAQYFLDKPALSHLPAQIKFV